MHEQIIYSDAGQPIALFLGDIYRGKLDLASPIAVKLMIMIMYGLQMFSQN